MNPLLSSTAVVQAVVGLLISVPLAAGLLSVAVSLQRAKLQHVQATVTAHTSDGDIVVKSDNNITATLAVNTKTLPSVGETVMVDMQQDKIVQLSPWISNATVAWIAYAIALLCAMGCIAYAVVVFVM